MPYTDYEQTKKHARERSKRISQAGREIESIPPILNVQRRRKCKRDLKQYITEYFKPKFDKPFGKNHLEYIKAVQSSILFSGNIAIGMPRGSGKTTIAKAAAHWAIVYGHRKFVIIVSAAMDEAKSFLDDMKEMFVSETFAEDFPEIAVPMEATGMSGRLTSGQTYLGQHTNIAIDKTRVRLPIIPLSPSAGNVIRCVGIHGKIRGKSEGKRSGETLRPDLIIIDDPQTDDDAINPNRVQKIENKIKRAVMGLVRDGDSAAMIMCCTVIEQGDVADRFLNREIYPMWNGLRFAMLERFPNAMNLWMGEYRRLRMTVSPEAATKFYKQNRKVMDEGAVVDWETNYDRKHALSRLEYAMQLFIDDEDSFWSERQNAPKAKSKAAIFVDAKTIRTRTNGYEQSEVPNDAQHLTAFIDVHDDLLYWCVTAFAEDFTAAVIDYGTFPEQPRKYFAKNDARNEKLQQAFFGETREGAIIKGLEILLSELLHREFRTNENTFVHAQKILVDSGYSYQAVEQAIARVRSPIVFPSIGKGIGAKQKPMDEYQNKPNEKIGNHYIIGKLNARRYPTIKIDVNYWKSEVHDALGIAAGSRGGLTLWGNVPEEHRLFSEHLTAEKATLVKTEAREIYEWDTKDVGKDNHWFDCVVGSFVAAATIGITKATTKPLPKRKFSIR
jgi:hypothetical protein